VAAGMIAEAVKSGGRSCHGTVIYRLAGEVELVRAAQSAARSPRALSRGDDCSSEQTEGASSRLSTTRDWHWTGCSRGGTPRARPCSPHGSPLWVSSPSLYTCLNIPELATHRRPRTREKQGERRAVARPRNQTFLISEIIDNTDTFGAHARATNHESDVLTER
jgi:hypothetical protein